MSSSTSLADRSRRIRIAKSRSRSRTALSVNSISSVASTDDTTPTPIASTSKETTPSGHKRRTLSNPPPVLVTPTRGSLIHKRDSSVPPEVVLGYRNTFRTVNDSSSVTSGASIGSEMGRSFAMEVPLDEEMPMDEMIHVMKRRTMNSPMLSVLPENEIMTKNSVPLDFASSNSRSTPKSYINVRTKVLVDAADRGGGGRSAMVDDDLSSLGIDESSLARLTLAIKSRTDKRPDHLNMEEKALWDVVQSTLINQTSEQIQKRRILERQVQDSSSRLVEIRSHNQALQKELEATSNELITLKGHLQDAKESKVEQSPSHKVDNSEKVAELERKLAEMEAKYKEAQDMFEKQQDEHDSAVRAIQRVMADVSSQREAEVEDLQQQLKLMKEERKSLEKGQLAGSAKDVATAPDGGVDLQNLRATADRALHLERELDDMKLVLETVEDERNALQLELDTKGGQLITLEKELSSLKDVVNKIKSKNRELEVTIAAKNKKVRSLELELGTTKKSMTSLAEREMKLSVENDTKDRQIVKLKRHFRSSSTDDSEENSAIITGTNLSNGNSADFEVVALLRKQLEEKDKALETSKMLIASLQDANGSMTVDLRAKLKEKDEHVSLLEAETFARKKTCDSLAVDLRDLQTLKSEMDQFEEKVKKDAMKQKILAKQLESAVSELQEASAVHEAKSSGNAGTRLHDEDDADVIAGVLCTAIMSLKMSLSSNEVESGFGDSNFIDAKSISLIDADTDIQSLSSIGGVDPQELNKHLDAIIRSDREAASKDLRMQLEAKSAAVQKLEELLQKEKDEVALMKMQNTRLKISKDEVEAKFNAEIVSLRGQCMTNMEVLTKKERELEVLRDSLEVSDGVGYISDESDEDDDDVPQLRSVTPPNGYGTAQAEAMATLLVHGSGVDGGGGEVQRLHIELLKSNREKERAAKELRIQQESLANAKMIISSLERANKTMLEDLRSRLQDSNTAIASLLDKSAENEKSSTSLKLELEKLKNEKEKVKADYDALLKKMKKEALDAAMRTTAKDRELAQLRLIAGTQEGSKSR